MISLRFDKGTLLLEGVEPGEVPPGFKWDERVGCARGMAIEYRDLVQSLHDRGVSYQDTVQDYARFESLVHTTDRTPRDYQLAAVERWERGGRRGQVILPTGSGKTYVAELCIARANRAALVVAPTIDLINQWQEVLEKAFGRSIGMLGGGQHELADITVSTYDSAFLHMERYGNRFGLIIFDEVHHLPSGAWSTVAEMSAAPFRLGLTATPERPDDAHLELEHLVGPVLYRRGIKELAGEVLADYETVRVEVSLTEEEAAAYEEARGTYLSFLSAKRIRIGGPGGWNRFMRAAARSKSGRAALRGHRESRRIIHEASAKVDALEDLLARHRDGRVLIFTNDNATVYKLSRELLVPCITHETPAKERREILAGFGSGRWRVVATSKVLNEGVDMPEADVGIVLSGSGTVREHVQRLGRILRPGENKKAVLYELVTTDTVEEKTSARRRDHDAYQ